ncbi:MAG: GNAT family N-acetyltransferase [Burkholderiales bacterium]|nr:GNAT family N-acetyltransferase [Burkholderiales bacterium]
MFNTHLHAVSPLGLADLPAMQAHLKRLDEIDRVQRFAQPASDQVIDRYLEHLNFLRDVFYGAHAETDDAQRPLVGLCHLALSANGRLAEIGVSVDADCRRRGIAKRLLERATLHAINLGVDEVVMYFLPYNTGLIELARQHGMSVTVGNGDGIARLAALSPSPVSVAAEWAATVGELTERSMRHLSEGACEASAAVRRLAVGEAG